MITVVANPFVEVKLQYLRDSLGRPIIPVVTADGEENIGHIEFQRYIFRCIHHESRICVTTDATELFADMENSRNALSHVIKTLIAQFNWVLEPEFERTHMS